MPTSSDGSLVLHGGQIRTMDSHDTITSAIAIDRGTIVALGDGALTALPDTVERLDLGGRTVLPGLIDAHSHIELATMSARLWLDVRFCEPEETLRRVSRAIADTPPGEWLVAQGTFGARLPTKAELDAVAPDNPVLVRESMHILSANSPALGAAGIDRGYVAPLHSRVERDSGGQPTGIVREGFDLFPYPRPAAEWFEASFPGVTEDLFLSHGATSVYELPASADGIRAWQLLHRQGKLPCRLTLNPILAPGHQPVIESLDDFLGLGLMTGFGDDWLRIGSVKLFVDGGDFVSGLYRSQLAGSPHDWGLMNFTYRELVSVLARCRQAGLQVWAHTVGNSAQDMTLSAIEEVNATSDVSDHRTRVEHLGNHMFDAGQIERIKACGAVAVPNPVFIFSEEPDVDESTPGARLYPIRSMIDAGLITPGNSDVTGTQPFAANPWFGIHAMLTRRTKGDRVLDPDQVVDLHTAIHTYTTHAAYAAFEEGTRGSLEVGKLGDLAVYPDDPYELDVEAVAEVEPDLTVIGGRIVFAREPQE